MGYSYVTIRLYNCSDTLREKLTPSTMQHRQKKNPKTTNDSLVKAAEKCTEKDLPLKTESTNHQPARAIHHLIPRAQAICTLNNYVIYSNCGN